MLKVIGTVSDCKQCPHRVYGSGGRYDCAKAGRAPLMNDEYIPEWCPLPNDPTMLAAQADRKIADAREVLTLACVEAETASPERMRSMLKIALEQITRH